MDEICGVPAEIIEGWIQIMKDVYPDTHIDSLIPGVVDAFPPFHIKEGTQKGNLRME
ncbi:MAG: hypothetical protein HXS54_13640 [Theionarchaea archaeon]|nr:hypothetical protein [Theionarchaea archaeon]